MGGRLSKLRMGYVIGAEEPSFVCLFLGSYNHGLVQHGF